MKTFFYMGKNPETKGGVSWKIWRIKTQGRRVYVEWGPADLPAKLVKRKPTAVWLRSYTYPTFPTPTAAKEFEQKIILSKLRKGYERSPRSRA